MLRLLMAYYSALDVPNFEQAHSYARELEDTVESDVVLRFELARFYVEWSTVIKLKLELDPLKEMLRQQKYKELADKALALLKSVPCSTHECQHLLAQSHYNKWEYDVALRHIDRAIASLPARST